MATSNPVNNINNFAICEAVVNHIVGEALQPYRDFPLRIPYVKTEETQALLQEQLDKFFLEEGRAWYDEGSKENLDYFHRLLRDTYDSLSIRYQAEFIADNEAVWDIFLENKGLIIDFYGLEWKQRYDRAYEKLCRDFSTPEEFSEFVDRHFAINFLEPLEAA